MSRHEIPAIGGVEKEPLEIQGSEVQGSEVQGSDVQGSGRFLFALAKTVVDLIDDELTVSDSNKCAGTKVSMSSRALRLGAGVVHSASKNCTKPCPNPSGPRGCDSCRLGARAVTRYLGS